MFLSVDLVGTPEENHRWWKWDCSMGNAWNSRKGDECNSNYTGKLLGKKNVMNASEKKCSISIENWRYTNMSNLQQHFWYFLHLVNQKSISNTLNKKKKKKRLERPVVLSKEVKVEGCLRIFHYFKCYSLKTST